MAVTATEKLVSGRRVMTRHREITSADVGVFTGLTTPDGGAGTPRAPGVPETLVLALATALISADPRVRVCALRDVRFARPVRVGEEIHVVGEVVDKGPGADQRATVELDMTVLNRMDHKVARARAEITCPEESDLGVDRGYRDFHSPDDESLVGLIPI